MKCIVPASASIQHYKPEISPQRWLWQAVFRRRKHLFLWQTAYHMQSIQVKQSDLGAIKYAIKI